MARWADDLIGLDPPLRGASWRQGYFAGSWYPLRREIESRRFREPSGARLRVRLETIIVSEIRLLAGGDRISPRLIPTDRSTHR